MYVFTSIMYLLLSKASSSSGLQTAEAPDIYDKFLLHPSPKKYNAFRLTLQKLGPQISFYASISTTEFQE